MQRRYAVGQFASIMPTAASRGQSMPAALFAVHDLGYRLGERVEPLFDQRRHLADIGQRLDAFLEDARFPVQPVGSQGDLGGVRVRLGAQRVDLGRLLAQPAAISSCLWA